MEVVVDEDVALAGGVAVVLVGGEADADNGLIGLVHILLTFYFV